MPWINGADAPIPVPLTTDAEGVVIAWRPEYHVNLPTWPQTPDELVADHAALEPFRRTPPLLARIFAGDAPENPTMTLALRFADEGAARAVLATWWADDE